MVDRVLRELPVEDREIYDDFLDQLIRGLEKQAPRTAELIKSKTPFSVDLVTATVLNTHFQLEKLIHEIFEVLAKNPEHLPLESNIPQRVKWLRALWSIQKRLEE